MKIFYAAEIFAPRLSVCYTFDMLTKDVLRHFKESREAIAEAIGITRSAPYQWRKVVPLGSAYRLQEVTKGKLKVNLSLYQGQRPIND